MFHIIHDSPFNLIYRLKFLVLNTKIPIHRSPNIDKSMHAEWNEKFYTSKETSKETKQEEIQFGEKH